MSSRSFLQRGLRSAALLLTLTLPAAAQRAQLWTGDATAQGQQVPVRLELSGPATHLHGAFLNGPERSAASSGVLENGHLVLRFDDYAGTLDGNIAGNTFTGSYSKSSYTGSRVSYPVVLHRGAPATPLTAGPATLKGDWEVAVHSAKGESAWTLRLTRERSLASAPWKGVILRIDGDTGGLYGGFDPHGELRLAHFTAAGPALFAVRPAADGTLQLTDLIHDRKQWTARRPQVARHENLAPPTAIDRQTTVKDPRKPFAFSFPDLNGHIVSNTDPRFRGKVVIVALGGSWCPNCHDEAPLLVDLYNRFHNQGLEIVNISFEEEDQLRDPVRLRAFIRHYHIPYTVLLGGTPDQVNEKIPQGKNLNCWPTSFFLGRDGRVKATHVGFAGPATGKSHEELELETVSLVQSLLRQPPPIERAER